MKKNNKLFGGVQYSFKGRNGDKDTLESIFGKKKIGPTDMTKLLWKYIKRRPDIKVTPK